MSLEQTFVTCNVFGLPGLSSHLHSHGFVRVSCHLEALVLSRLLDYVFYQLDDILYTLAHLPILVPFFAFWKVDRETKMKGAAFGAPLFVGWIALLGGWLRF